MDHPSTDKPRRARGIMHVRPKGPMTPEAELFYSPGRDLGHIGPSLIAGSLRLLLDNPEPWMADYMNRHGITNDEVRMFLEAMRRYFKNARDPKFDNIDDAARDSGILGGNIRPEVSVLGWSRIGQVVVGLLFPFLRQVCGFEKKRRFNELEDVMDQAIQFWKGDENGTMRDRPAAEVCESSQVADGQEENVGDSR